jgi:6-phosphofructokinase 1
MIVEVMGRRAGWIGLHSGVAGGGDIILIPEIPYDINIISEKVKERNRKGKKCSVIVVAGSQAQGGIMIRGCQEQLDPIALELALFW